MSSRKITALSHTEARRFFLKHSSYINFDIPDYLNFEEILMHVSAYMGSKEIANVCKGKSNGKPDYPCDYERVNHIILSNKDGAYSWRPMQIIHPVLYVYLIRLITEKKNWEYIQNRFNLFSKTSVNCISIPRESDSVQSDKASQVKFWWENIEQHSIKKSLEFNYVFTTDITDCYGAIYTHSIEWALDKDGKEGVKKKLKEKKNSNSLGQKIDVTIRHTTYNQTNGIPQGSTLMDFIAEIILGYADEQLTKAIKINKINKNSFQIVRYRDDYRIFVNDPNIGHKILKLLSTTLYDLGLKMNAAKTMDSNDVILTSIKKEKLERISIAPTRQSLQKEALRIYQLSKKYPNSGLLTKELSYYYDDINKTKKYKYSEDVESIIVIFTMIAFYSPKVINWVSAIISVLFERKESKTIRKVLIKKMHNRFKSIPQTGLIDIWLQRISAPSGINIDYSDNLTKIALGKIKNSELWCCDWLKDEVISLLDVASISSLKEKIENKTISPIIQRSEVELFKDGYF